ncbi:MAG: hypothetical protein KatS3mg035_1116 [Bacteroidia bacterium]|nr:MAG: hypothetical protein KatS3mg035_1116 [Bacteroidia bacterium]
MATFNTNYQIVPLTTAGTYGPDVLGDGLTATTVHEIYCLTPGSITITASGGGKATIPMTAGQSVKCMVREVIVTSGTYIGFRAKLESRGQFYYS